MKKDNRISEIIQNQLPSFFQEEGSNLPLFLTKYFEFLESYQIEYTDLILDEFNIVLEDDNDAYYIYGTALDDGLMYTTSDEGLVYDVGLQTGYYFPVYGNKSAAVAASDNAEVVYELHLEEFQGRTFYMPQKGGESGINFGVFENDPPTTTLTKYITSGTFVLEDTLEDATANNELLVESDRDPTTTTFSLGELIVGSVSGTEAIITGLQNEGEQGGKFQSANTASKFYKSDPHLLFARPTNGKAFRHGETIIGKRSRAKAYVGKSNKDIKRNPLRGASDLDLVNDVDDTDNMYLERFRNDFLTNIPIGSVGDLRQAIKTAREIYRARGTEDSFLWLWRTVYGSEQLSFIYPKERLLRPSDGTWQSLKSIKIYGATATYPDMFNSKVIRGEESQASATVDNSISYFEGTTQITELFLTDYTKGYDVRFDTYSDFKADETVATSDAYVSVSQGLFELMNSNNASDTIASMAFPTTSSKGTCIAVIGTVEVLSAGTGYKVNDELVFTNSPGQGAIARVGATANGAIDEIIIDDGGNGFIGGETLVVNSLGTGGSGHTGVISKTINTGMYRSSNAVISEVISTSDGGNSASAIYLNAASFSIGSESSGVRYPENINTHFSSSNTLTWIATVANQDTADGGANILLETGDGQVVLDSTDGSADAGDNILFHTVAFEDDIQPGYYVYDPASGAKGTIAGPSVNTSSFVYALESSTSPNFVEGSYGSLYYSANGSAVAGKSNMFTFSKIQPASWFELLEDDGTYTNQFGDGTKAIFDYYGGTTYTYTGVGAISETRVVTTGIEYLKGPTYEAKNESTLGLEQWRFEDPLTGKNTARLTYLNFANNIYGTFRSGENVIGLTSGTKGKVILPYVNSSSNSTFSTMKILPEETTLSLEDENVVINGDFEAGNITGLTGWSSKRLTPDSGSHTLSLETTNTISESNSGKMAVDDQLDIYVGFKALDSETGQAYANSIIPGNQYNAKISFRTSTSLKFVELRYGHSENDIDYEANGVYGGLTEAVCYTHGETTNADQVYTFEGKFVASSDRYHAIYLFANTVSATTYDLHIDGISIADISTRGKFLNEGFSGTDNAWDVDDYMVLEQGDWTAGEVVMSLNGTRQATLSSTNTAVLEAQSNYGNNAILKAGALKTGAIKNIAVSSAGINYSLVPDVTAPSGDGNATFLAKRTAITDYPGKFKDKLGMVSDIIRIQDSYYYQDFSYVLRSDIQINEFRDLVRSFVHPAGWNVFGEIGILLLIDVNVDASSDTIKKLELFVDRTPSYVPTYGPLTVTQRGVDTIYNNTTQGPHTSIYGQINFDVGIIHNYHVEFLDPRTLGFGVTTDDKHFAFHAGRVDWLNGLGWDYEQYNRGLAGQFDPNAPYKSNNTEDGRKEIPHHFPEHDQAQLNSTTKIVPWYPNVIMETRPQWATADFAGMLSDPVHTTHSSGATAGAQRPADTYWGTLGGDGNPRDRKGGIEYWPEIGILGKYTSPDGNETMPLVSTHVSYGHEEIELLANLWKTNFYLETETHLETLDRWGLQRIQLDLPDLTGVNTYVSVAKEVMTKFADGVDKAINRSITHAPNPAEQIIAVTVSGVDFLFDGVNINDNDWTRELIKGVTYRFNVEDSSNNSYTLKFASVSDGSHNGSWASTMEFPSTAVGTPGTGGAYVDFKIPDYTYETWIGNGVAGASVAQPVLYAYGSTANMAGPIKTVNKSVAHSYFMTKTPPIANISTTPEGTVLHAGTQANIEGRSFARPRDIRLRNPATFIVATAKVYAGMVVGLRPDGKVERVYESSDVLFPRINYVHSLLGIAQQDAAVGETLEVRDTNSTEERVFELKPGAVYYPDYSSSMMSYITTTPPTLTAADSLDRVRLGKASTKDALELDFPQWKIHEYRANEDISKGQVVGLMSNGKIQLVFCEVDGTAKPQLDGVHSLLGLASEDIASGEYGEVLTFDKTLQMSTFPSGSYNALPGDGLTKGTKYYVDYRDATIKAFGTYSNHPDNVLGEALDSDLIKITCKLPNHQTYSPQWDLTTIAYPYPTYTQIRTLPNPDEFFRKFEQLGTAMGPDQVIESMVITNITPVENIEQGQTVLFDDINIILEESDGMLLEDGDEILTEDGTFDATSAIGKIMIESDFLLYEDIINTGIGQDPNAKINIYSRTDAKYIVGDLTTSSFNIHNRGNKYFPEGIIDTATQHTVLE